MFSLLSGDIIAHIMSFEDIITLNKNTMINNYIKCIYTKHKNRLCDTIIKKNNITLLDYKSAYNFCMKNYTKSICKNKDMSLIKAMHISNLF